jgi:hypothetical protein
MSFMESVSPYCSFLGALGYSCGFLLSFRYREFLSTYFLISLVFLIKFLIL